MIINRVLLVLNQNRFDLHNKNLKSETISNILAVSPSTFFRATTNKPLKTIR
jgi:hypothetical protein